MATDNKNNQPVSIASETLISRPVSRESLPVSWSDWDFVKGRIARCQVRPDIWGYVASFFLSVALCGFAVAWVETGTWRAVFFVITIAGVLLATICYLARRSIKHAQGESINTVLGDMEQIEGRYQRPPSDKEE